MVMAYFMPSHPKHGLRTSADELQCTRRQSVELLTHGLTIFPGGGRCPARYIGFRGNLCMALKKRDTVTTSSVYSGSRTLIRYPASY